MWPLIQIPAASGLCSLLIFWTSAPSEDPASPPLWQRKKATRCPEAVSWRQTALTSFSQVVLYTTLAPLWLLSSPSILGMRTRCLYESSSRCSDNDASASSSRWKARTRNAFYKLSTVHMEKIAWPQSRPLGIHRFGPESSAQIMRMHWGRTFTYRTRGPGFNSPVPPMLGW